VISNKNILKLYKITTNNISKQMALCLDRTDPSGMGMFSNCGRREIKKYIIFTKKDEIMNNNQRFFDPNAI